MRVILVWGTRWWTGWGQFLLSRPLRCSGEDTCCQGVMGAGVSSHPGFAKRCRSLYPFHWFFSWLKSWNRWAEWLGRQHVTFFHLFFGKSPLHWTVSQGDISPGTCFHLGLVISNMQWSFAIPAWIPLSFLKHLFQWNLYFLNNILPVVPLLHLSGFFL